MWALRIIDPLSLVAEYYANSGHTFAFQNAEILNLGNNRVTRIPIEVWHTQTTLINRCVALPAAFQAIRAQLIECKSKHEIGPNVNPTTGEPRTDMHVTTPQSGTHEGAGINTAASTTTPTDEETCSRKDTNRTSNSGCQLRSMRTRERAANCQKPPLDETCQLTAIILPPFALVTTEMLPVFAGSTDVCPLCGCRECRYVSARVAPSPRETMDWSAVAATAWGYRPGGRVGELMCHPGRVTADRCLLFSPRASAAGPVQLLSPVPLALSELT
ncbi:unnamed protein product [Schistocephalus solidus]|uniref:Uncharacterized protein n=1 Tax=Schistocephalus solidus TaxID=70667 RepID=A0A183SLJ4_SCHSO|nr:unnamed protein product [Schistocephalus solidus]